MIFLFDHYHFEKLNQQPIVDRETFTFNGHRNKFVWHCSIFKSRSQDVRIRDIKPINYLYFQSYLVSKLSELKLQFVLYFYLIFHFRRVMSLWPRYLQANNSYYSNWRESSYFNPYKTWYPPNIYVYYIPTPDSTQPFTIIASSLLFFFLFNNSNVTPYPLPFTSSLKR